MTPFALPTPTEEKVSGFIDEPLVAETFTEDFTSTVSGAIPSDWLLGQMKKQAFNFTGTFVTIARSALLDYEPPTPTNLGLPPHYELAKMHYKLQPQAGFAGTLIWFEVFTPTDTTKPKQYIPMAWAMTSTDKETPVYVIDPSGADSTDANAASRDPKQNGAWQVVPLSVQFRLLNGQTQDFQGKTPTTIDDPDLSPDNSTTSIDIEANANIDKLGIDTPFGSGRPTDIPPGQASYTYSLLVLAEISPASDPHITYSWDRVYRDRSVTITKSADGTQWNVRSINNGKRNQTGFPNPVQDMTGDVYHTTALSANNILYSYDNPAMGLDFFANCNVLDYAYEEVDFTYKLSILYKNSPSTEDFTVQVGQIIAAGKTHSTGVTAKDWTGKGNVVGTANIPTCLITEAKARAIVGGGLPIVIDPNANSDNPNP